MIQSQLLREEKEIKHFDKLANQYGYAWWGSQTPAAKLRIKRRASLLTNYLRLKPGNKLLECGCGAGDFTLSIFNELGDKVLIHAIDISESQINIAKDKLKNPSVSFEVQSIANMEFEDNYFDFVVGNSILHHVDFDLAIKEIKRVLKAGGSLLFFEPNMLNPQVWLSLNIKLFRELSQASPNETAFYSGQLRRKLNSSSFNKAFVKPFDFIHPLIPELFLELAKKIEQVLEKTFLKEVAGSLIIFAEK